MFNNVVSTHYWGLTGIIADRPANILFRVPGVLTWYSAEYSVTGVNPISIKNVYLTLALTLFVTSAGSMEISGTARVVDADTFAIGSQVIRLHGVDAPENGQDCIGPNGKRYNCGAAAEKALQKLLNDEISCSGDIVDDYKRLIAVCTSGERQINRTLVLSGWALAFRKFSTDYVSEEDTARQNERGLWAGTFTPPWEWRADKWTTAIQDVPDSECPIKGNINSKGERIYHAPWSRSYRRTKINTAKGERWFCTEAEALAAGWRAPYR